MEAALAVAQAKYWHLKQVDLFTCLEDWEIRQLGGFSDLRLYRSGESLYRPGDSSDRLYVIRSGKVKLFKPVGDRRAIILGIHGEGEILGELAVFGEEVRHEHAEVVDDAFLCSIDRDRLRSYLSAHLDLTLRIAQVVAGRKDRAEKTIVDLLSKDVRRRLAQLLLRLVGHYGIPDGGLGLRIDLRLTQTTLAQMVGSTRETTSMAFNEFRRGELVDSQDRWVWVRDEEGLAAV